ncbi:DUF4913 domain-containing protein [Arthrobacter jiangjiafuii]|uniref:DUF4913 domain-containing protein n=1 Tax=Arthrobacter jiangjiafuii TaxID=2817475 RepID=A0A975R2L4_9MICC|nr:DUF4913 domain-containing protein [Arthrobacter jiangjiafuii]QWC11718.1 DUF4913 domain-containing protein [Arthrobacter jiangjiafuii]
MRHAPVSRSVNEFFRDYLRHVYKRRVGHSRCWNPEWWRVDEAVVRLESLWRAWEFLRQDASTGTSIWFRDHADHHMNALMDADGPFGDSLAETGWGDPLPHTEPPEGLFPDIRE